MNNAQGLLKAFLSTSKHPEALLHYLPPKLAEEVQNLSLGQSFVPAAFFSPSDWSLSIHYSWFSESIQEYPPQVKELFLAQLKPSQSAGIQQMLGIKTEKTKSSPFLRPFLMDVLRAHLQGQEILDEQLLPPSAMNALLQLERKHLIHSVDLLGLHDLAADLRQVVDKELLRKIYNALDQELLHFLNYCSKQPLKWVPPKLGLSGWDGSREQLKSLLHFRGLIRIAKAIVNEDESYKWHLLHRFDTGRAKIIQKELYRKQDPSLFPFFKNQVLHIVKRYQS